MISDRSALIAFARAGRLALLEATLQQIIVPPAVWREVASDPGRPGAMALRAAKWIVVTSPSEAPPPGLRASLGPGEREAIALALETGDTLLVDERLARMEAQRLGVSIVGSGGVLVAAKWRGLIPEIAPVLQELEDVGLHISQSIRDAVLRKASEK